MPCKANIFKTRVAAGEKLIGLWCSLTSATSVEALSTIDYDWFLLDMEHAPNELRDIVDQLRVLDSSTPCGFVRPPCNDRIIIKRLLDAGAKNFLFPYVQNVEEAQDIIRATRYAPDGVRGVSTAGRAAHYGDYPNYLQTAADEIVIAIQIETTAAVQDLPAMLALADIDIVFFGPADLSADMGLLGQPEHPEVRATITACIKQVTAAGKMAGVLAPNIAIARAYYEAGAKFVAVGSDLACLRTQAKTLLASTKDF